MSHATLSVVVFVLVMIVIISEKVHRAVVAVGGAVLLIILGVLDIETGVSYIDYNTIGLLIGMMLFVAVVKHSGIFEYLAVKSAKIAKGDPWKMMIVFIIITALLSALLDNVTTVLLVAPMTFAITKAMDLNPVPYIMTQILASNIGGTATLIGDPPNIMIGSATGLSFCRLPGKRRSDRYRCNDRNDFRLQADLQKEADRNAGSDEGSYGYG